MRITVPSALLVALAAPLPSFADERPSGTVAVGSRVFLAPGQPDRQPSGVPPADAPWMHVTVDLNEVDRLRAMRDADPLLAPHGAQLKIRRLPDPPSVLFGDEAATERYGTGEDVRDELLLDGFDVRARFLNRMPDGPLTEINVRPIDPAAGYMVTCFDGVTNSELGAFVFCSLDASYPPDPFITLTAQLDPAEPLQSLVADFPAMAARLREIALCLDVTEEPPSDPETALATLLATNPSLSECEDKLLS